jgi:crossover junction endodeoxyribonuclease RuvC
MFFLIFYAGFFMSVILGIDPGLNITGYGVIETTVGSKLRLLEAGVVRSHSETLAFKVREIYDGVREIITTFSPIAVAIEVLYSHYNRPRTAIYMGHARGAICLAAAQSEIAIHSYSATKIKKLLTGAGRAPKEQMQRAIQFELHLDRLPEPPDVADALAAALCHFYHGKIR